MKFRSIFLVVALIVTISCSPIYETQYDYIPPKSKSSKPCIMQCNYMKSNCYQHCKSQQQACQLQHNIIENSRSYALNRCDSDKGRCDYLCKSNPLCKNSCEFSWRECKRSVSLHNSYKTNCSSERCEKLCLSDYNTCFIGCGGEVRQHRACIAFCDKG